MYKYLSNLLPVHLGEKLTSILIFTYKSQSEKGFAYFIGLLTKQWQFTFPVLLCRTAVYSQICSITRKDLKKHCCLLQVKYLYGNFKNIEKLESIGSLFFLTNILKIVKFYVFFAFFVVFIGKECSPIFSLT